MSVHRSVESIPISATAARRFDELVGVRASQLRRLQL
jgi:hypothetical protein